MNAVLDAIPAWQRGVRRAANTIGENHGHGNSAAPVLGARSTAYRRKKKNITPPWKNWKTGGAGGGATNTPRVFSNLLTDVDMDYNPTWPESRNRELISMGHNSKEDPREVPELAGWK